MPPKFGTSGLRGLVRELGPALVGDYTRAFLRSCPVGNGLWVGRDLRASSPDIAAMVIAGAKSEGVKVVDCGAVPTPALALASMAAGAAAVMVTGSHIPADRNGLKFYLPTGEITKADETAILSALGGAAAEGDAPLLTSGDVGERWLARYVAAFGEQALAGLRLGVWSHSAVSRDLLIDAFRSMGAEVRELGRSDRFIPVDTEAVDRDTRSMLAAWAAEFGLDAIVSTDGDGDRPLLADGAGNVVPGDVLGQITARVLGAEVVVTPVSSNSGVEASGRFSQVIRTKIGSPYVIAGMDAAGPTARAVGYEANGGFLLGFEAMGPAGTLPPLATRDSLLPLVSVLWAARQAGGLAELLQAEPPRYTAADRLQDVPTERSAALIARLLATAEGVSTLLDPLGEAPAATDLTDGLRITLASGRVLHLRPSGNAPEFRLYVEAESPSSARELLALGLDHLRVLLG